MNDMPENFEIMRALLWWKRTGWPTAGDDLVRAEAFRLNMIEMEVDSQDHGAWILNCLPELLRSRGTDLDELLYRAILVRMTWRLEEIDAEE